MKNLIFIVLILALFSCSKKSDDSQNSTDGLKGKIRTISELVYSTVLIDGIIQKNQLITTRGYKYDESGKITEEYSYTSNGEIEYRIVYSYLNKDSFESIRYGLDGDLQSKDKGTLDANGNKLEVNSYDSSGKLELKYKYTYNNKIQLIELLMYDQLKSVEYQEYKFLYEYDSGGNLVKDSNYDYAGELIYTISYSYSEFDKNDNWLIQKGTYNSESNFITERTIEYY